MSCKNEVILVGKIVSEVEFNHEYHKENHYKTYISVKRMSGAKDIIPVIIPERVLDENILYVGNYVCVKGQFRSYSKKDSNKYHISLFVYATDLEESNAKVHKNNIMLEGYVCKPANYRVTPLGREITDLIIASNRNFGKSDYLPCIVWGRLAYALGKVKAGEHISLSGRVQSREYVKDKEKKIAYEISVDAICIIDDCK